MIDCPFNIGSYLIKGSPFGRIPLAVGEHTEIHMFINVSGFAPFGSRAVFLQSQINLPYETLDSPI